MSVFLEAKWRDLVMLSWTVDPSMLAPRVPAGTTLDLFEGRCFVSLIAFRFEDTVVRGIPIPFHRDFEEINLRFYVTRREGAELRRGVVFIKEIVPRAAIAFVARTLYGEPYEAMPTSSRIREDAKGKTASYAWRQGARAHSVRMECGPDAAVPAAGTVEGFIAEHYWGYTARGRGATDEYRVEHPAWMVRASTQVYRDLDAGALYGPEFAEVLAGPPESAFLAEGSRITVHAGRRLTPP